MKTSTRRAAALGSACLGVLVLGGCGSRHYAVTDPASGNIYYTRNVDRTHGAVTLKDAKTGSKVTLQSSEVKTITKKEYKEAVKAQ